MNSMYFILLIQLLFFASAILGLTVSDEYAFLLGAATGISVYGLWASITKLKLLKMKFIYIIQSFSLLTLITGYSVINQEKDVQIIYGLGFLLFSLLPILKDFIFKTMKKKNP